MPKKRAKVIPSSKKAEKILNRIESMSVFGGSKKIKKEEKPLLSFPNYRETQDIPSSTATVGRCTKPVEPKYEGEMAEREKAAQIEISKKKKQIAIPYSKGAYMYIGGMDKQALKDLGKKTSQIDE